MRCRIQLELLHRLRLRRGRRKGFTLVELMIVVAVAGLLAAVIIPTFLAARTTAQAGAQIGETVGLAKECAIFIASGGVGPNPDAQSCIASVGGTFTATWSPVMQGQLVCLGVQSTQGASQATINVDTNGTMSCAFG
ncbi:MAG: type II secretion system protein [Cyanobium sp.]